MRCDTLFSLKNKKKREMSSATNGALRINPCPAEPGHVLLLKTVLIKISWLLQKPTDLNLHCLSLNM